MVFGAQVVGGEGDGDCLKDITIVWSETLQQHAHKIMKEYSDTDPESNLVKLWIVFAAFSRSHGNSKGKPRSRNTKDGR